MNVLSDPRWTEALSHLCDYLGSHLRVSITALALGLAISLPLALIALGIGLVYLMGGLSNRVIGPHLLSTELRLRIGSRVMAAAAIVMLVLSLVVGLRIWTLVTPVLVMGFCAGAMYPTFMAKGNSLFPHIAGLTSAILGCALILVSAAAMGLAGFVSVEILAPLAGFFVVLALTVVWMVTKLLRHMDPQPAVVARGSEEAA